MKNRNEIAAVEFPVSPIRIRECKCGCGYEFQPNRKDQLYIDKRHYDFDYNQNKRKVKNKHIIETEKQLRLNNRVLEKHYKAIETINKPYDYQRWVGVGGKWTES